MGDPLGWKLSPVVFYRSFTLRNATRLSFQPNNMLASFKWNKRLQFIWGKLYLLYKCRIHQRLLNDQPEPTRDNAIDIDSGIVSVWRIAFPGWDEIKVLFVFIKQYFDVLRFFNAVVCWPLLDALHADCSWWRFQVNPMLLRLIRP